MPEPTPPIPRPTPSGTNPIELPTGDDLETVVPVDPSGTASGLPLGPAQAAGELGRLGPYRVLRLLGEGGMGFVYLAEDTALHRPVALKVMRPDVAARPAAKERFLREGRAAAKVKNDHVVTIYAVGEEAGVPFMALEYLEGRTLDDDLKEKPSPASADEVVKVARDALRGLAAAHAKGLVHRDIKPANLWIDADTGRVKVLDFGLTRDAGGADLVTNPGGVVGTPAYMAPEQAGGKEVDGRADLFALGVVLYRMVAGHSPFQRGDIFATLTALALEVPKPLTGIPPTLAAFIARLMAKNPDDRPAGASEALAELAAAEGSVTGGGVHMPTAPRLSGAASWPPTAGPAAVPGGNSKRVLAVAVAGVVAMTALLSLWRDNHAVVAVATDPAPKPSEAAPSTSPVSPRPTVAEAPRQIDPQPVAAGWKPVPFGESPFDTLDAAAIPKDERFEWQPKELVALLGSHKHRTWNKADGGVTYSPDGSMVVAAGGGWRMWNAKTLAPVAEGRGQKVLAFSPDGKRLIGGWNAGTFEEWELARKPLGSVPVPDFAATKGYALGLWFSADRTTAIYHASGDGQANPTITIWDMTQKPAKLSHTRSDASVYSHGTAVAADGKHIAYFSPGEAPEQGKIFVGKVTSSGAVFHPIPFPASRFGGLALSPDGTRLAAFDEGKPYRVWDLEADPPTAVDFGNAKAFATGQMAFTPDGKRLLTCMASAAFSAGGATFQLWDVTLDKPKDVWTQHPVVPTMFMGQPPRVAIAPDGKTAALLGGAGLVQFVELAADGLKFLNPVLPAEPAFGGFLIDGKRGEIAATPAGGIRYQWWRTTGDRMTGGNRLAQAAGERGTLRARWLLPDGSAQVVPTSTETAVFQAAGGKLQRAAAFPAVHPGAGTLTDDGRTAWTMTPDPRNRAVEGWDLAGAEPQRKSSFIPPAGGGEAFNLSLTLHKNETVLACLNRGKLTLWDVTATPPALLSTLPTEEPLDYGRFAVAPDGSRVLARKRGHPLRSWVKDADGWREERILAESASQGFEDAPPAAFHPSSHYFAMATETELTVRTWADRIVWRTQLKSLPQRMEFAPDGRHLVVANGYHTIHVLRLDGLDTPPKP